MQRLGLLVRNDAVRNSRTIVSVCALFVAIVLLGNFIMPEIPSLRDNYYLGCFAALLFLWGIAATSRSFKDLHDKTRNEAYLLIPASAIEKTLARLVALTAIFVVFLLMLSFLSSLAVEGLNAVLGRTHNALFDPFNGAAWQLIFQYVVIQSYFFLGATWFRRAHFIKTSLVITVTFGALILIASASMRLFLGSYWWNNIGNATNVLDLMYGSFFDIVLAGVQLTNYVVMPAVCWYTAYLRVRETQVSDGV